MTISMPHLKIKFPMPNGVAVCTANQKVARDAYLEALRGDRVCLVDMVSSQCLEVGIPRRLLVPGAYCYAIGRGDLDF